MRLNTFCNSFFGSAFLGCALLSGCFASGQRDSLPHSGANNAGDGEQATGPGGLVLTALTSQALSTQGLSDTTGHGPTLSFHVVNLAAGDELICTVSKDADPTLTANAACAADANGNVAVDITPVGANHRGAYSVAVVITRGSQTAVQLTQHTYIHDSLNNVAHCTESLAADVIFSKALESMPKSGTFGTATVVKNPAPHVVFANGSAGDILSLRRRFALNSDRSLLLVEREYGSTNSSGTDCTSGIVLSGLRPIKVGGNFPAFTSACKYLVVNAAGAGVCLSQTGTTLAVVDQLTNMQKRLFNHAYDRPFNRTKTKNAAQAQNDPGYWVYLPD